MKLSEQQQQIVNSELSSMQIIACAGSGKTETAIQKLIKLRSDMADDRGCVTLLSFTNAAIKTFRDRYFSLTSKNTDRFKNRVCIETIDSFITTNILRPHSFRIMGCKSTPFLISGKESFLKNKGFQYWYTMPLNKILPVKNENINNVTIKLKGNDIEFYYKENKKEYPITNGFGITKKLGKIGAYTHELGKYWVLKTLSQNENLLSAIIRRFPIIIVDEAQDIDVLHGLILKLLHKAGCKLILIGDPNQAIFEFSGANGDFLKSFEEKSIKNYPLSINYRSVPKIVSVANLVSNRKDKANRQEDSANYGIYYVLYDKDNIGNLVNIFISKVEEIGLNIDNSAVLYRNRSGIDKLLGTRELGQGKTKLLALATIKRDKHKKYKEAFDIVVQCISGLLSSLPNNFAELVNHDPKFKQLKQMIWIFIRNPSKGLPLGEQLAKNQWYPALKLNISNLLKEIESNYGFQLKSAIGNVISSKNLPNEPLINNSTMFKRTIRVDTVHQVKGESLDAVLYISTEKEHLKEMINGTKKELGRIGYVALTRAKNLFVIGIQKEWYSVFTKTFSDLNVAEL